MKKELVPKQETENKEIVELKDADLSTIAGGECVHSVEPMPDGMKPILPDSDIALVQTGDLLQQAAKAMLASENRNAASVLGLLQ
ncbi:MAG: hypothetical protein MJ247_07230 [Alphaproteobacteria bacterium]|nr:hypothetical protein [Alphaproteobacteria bacterium]